MLDLGDWEGVLRAAEERPGDPRAAEAAVRAAFETEDPDLSRRAVTLLSQVPDGELNPLPGFRRMLREVRTAGQDECPSWAAWLERVGRPEAWDRAAEVLRAESANWDIAEFASGSIGRGRRRVPARGFEQRERRPGPAEPGPPVRAGAQPGCPAAGDPLVQAIMMVVSEQPNPSRQVQEALRGLLEPLLDSGPRRRDVTPSTWPFSTMLGRRCSRAPRSTGALDIADLLISAPCPDPAARAAVRSGPLSWALGHRQQLAHRQAVMANMLADQAGLGREPGDRTERVRARQHLGAPGRRPHGLYSLLPRAGIRLQERLCELAGGRVAVEQNDDHVATPGLQSLAAHADFMIVDTWHATHSATIAIDAVLPRDRQMLPRGGGVMSFLAALQDRLEAVG